MAFVYRWLREAGCYTVGHYRPDGAWEPESDHATPEEASRRTEKLNGNRPAPARALGDFTEEDVRIVREFALEVIRRLDAGTRVEQFHDGPATRVYVGRDGADRILRVLWELEQRAGG